VSGQKRRPDLIGRPEIYPACKSGVLDPGIERIVNALLRNGIETTESCQGGKSHGFRQPTVIFRGSHADAIRALSVAIGQRDVLGMEPDELRLVWKIRDGLPTEPEWWLTWRR
jgi:hypothetical protein